MKGNIFIKVLLILISSVVYSQESMKSNKGEYLMHMDIGIATLEAENIFKTNAQVLEVFVGKEFLMNNTWAIITGIEHSKVKSDYSSLINEQLFLTNNYLSLPLYFQGEYKSTDKLTVYARVGFYASYLYYSKLENINLNQNSSNKNLGLNYGAQIGLGINYKIAEDLGVLFGVKSKSDMFNNYRDSKQEFKLTNFYALEFGLIFNVF
ncbi:outer membrane beta-barrel protein [Lacinutrix sp. WUR7]|uniref:outer membrane beta-barrel protein n=1 Tax=Lacinutrix sp. WUR7 TaxID=2653681 RepID=UPI00193E51C0|nr:outer membrane beta-barrel protein [Lacinutrix sp. WUR7]QRM89582.1 outer membrane beta-barrel protein [Lacinutrix sp. WUR7]